MLMTGWYAMKRICADDRVVSIGRRPSVRRWSSLEIDLRGKEKQEVSNLASISRPVGVFGGDDDRSGGLERR